MSEQERRDPLSLWTEWFEAGSQAWTEALKGARESSADPYQLFQKWMEASGNGAQSGMLNPFEMMSGMDPKNSYLKWLEQAADSWRRATESGQTAAELAPRWAEMLEKIRDNLLKEDEFPSDPLQLAVQWYNATSGPFSEFVGDLIEREEFLEPSSRLLNNYASFYNVFQRNSEDYIRSLSLPVRSDITRVASMVVALEEKVENLSEVFEDFQYGGESPASSRSVEALEERLDRVEGKLDRLISAMESNSSNEVKATEAARRKAQELGVDLHEVEASGANGQITVEDVRKKGES